MPEGKITREQLKFVKECKKKGCMLCRWIIASKKGYKLNPYFLGENDEKGFPVSAQENHIQLISQK